MSSKVQLNNTTFEIANGKTYINGCEVIENKIQTKSRDILSAMFAFGFIAGIYSGWFLTTMVQEETKNKSKISFIKENTQETIDHESIKES